NALWFTLFGVSLRTLAVANLALLAAITVLLRALLVRAGTRPWAATAAALVFLAVCGFGRQVANGSFNFVCPYAHEATHGFLRALGALLCALRAGDGQARRPATWAGAAGACCGLAFLTKPEGFMAGLGASALVLLLGARTRAPRALAAFAGGVIAPALLAF